LINPLIPQSWGTFDAGGHPQITGRKYPAPLIQQSLIESAYNGVMFSAIPNAFRNLKFNTIKQGMLKQVQHDKVEEISYIELIA
jgi:hypothetical protein